MTRSRVTDKDPDNAALPGQDRHRREAGGSGCRSTHCGLDPAARQQLRTHRQFPGDIQGAGGRGVMLPSNVMFIMFVMLCVCMTAMLTALGNVQLVVCCVG